MTTELRPPETAETQSVEPTMQPRVAALPGAERRILRKRLERPLKVIRKRPRAVRRTSR